MRVYKLQGPHFSKLKEGSCQIDQRSKDMPQLVPHPPDVDTHMADFATRHLAGSICPILDLLGPLKGALKSTYNYDIILDI